MEASVALSSLKQTVKCLKDSSHFSISSSSGEIIDVLEKTVRAFEQEVDSKSLWKTGNESSRQIRDAVLEMEDLLESHLSDQLLSSPSEDTTPLPVSSFSVDLEEIKKHVDLFAQNINNILMGDSGRSNDDDDDDDDDLHSGGSLNDRYFGLSDQFKNMKVLLQRKLPLGHQVTYLLSGMAGIGKTALANKLFHDPDISSLFQYKAFVTVGKKYQFERVLEDIKKQLMDNPEVDGGNMLIVLDDLWDTKLLVGLFLENRIWPRRALTILLFSRLKDISANLQISLRFMDKNESWDLLRHKLFDKTPCPPQLEKAGQKIAERCQGLPLTTDIMSKADENTSEEFWNKVATQKRNLHVISNLNNLSNV